jgi:hypothetical protein
MDGERDEALWGQLEDVENLDELRLIEYYGLTEAEAAAVIAGDDPDAAERVATVLEAAAVLESKLTSPHVVGAVLRSSNAFIDRYYPEDAGKTLVELAWEQDGPKKVLQAAHDYGSCQAQRRGDYLHQA